MGGPGSGRILRWNTKSTTESQHRIDIRWLNKHGYLKPGSIGTLSWSRNGEQTGSIKYRMEDNKIILDYKHRPRGGEWEDAKQVISFDQTACNYGGFRKWFLCPRCGERVALFYGADKYFLCRHCCELTYGSCNSSPFQRTFDRANKLRKKLGGHSGLAHPIPERPKGMHHST